MHAAPKDQDPAAPTKRNMFFNPVFWTIAVVAVLAMPDESSSHLLSPESLGNNVGQFIVVTAVAWLGWRAGGRSNWGILVAVLLLGITQSIPHLSALEAPESTAKSDYAFSPPSSEYIVRFPGKPRVTTVTTDMPDAGLIGMEILTAELDTPGGILRAESTRLPLPGVVDKEFGYAGAREHARQNGLDIVDLRWEETALGKIVHLRGTKVLRSQGVDEAVTFRFKCIYGDESMMMVTAGSPSSSFPFEGALEFLDSVERTN